MDKVKYSILHHNDWWHVKYTKFVENSTFFTSEWIASSQTFYNSFHQERVLGRKRVSYIPFPRTAFDSKKKSNRSRFDATWADLNFFTNDSFFNVFQYWEKGTIEVYISEKKVTGTGEESRWSRLKSVYVKNIWTYTPFRMALWRVRYSEIPNLRLVSKFPLQLF